MHHNLEIFKIEKKLIFLINTFLIILMSVFFLMNLPLKYFFYINLIITFIISYIFFIRSKKLSKYLIVTNLFIFFYFLYPYIANYLYLIFEEESYMFILLYNIFIAYVFLMFSGHHRDFLKNIRKFNLKILLLVFLIGMVFGLLFFMVKEPVPITSFFNPELPAFFSKVIFFTLILALSEQIIFSGFLYNVYKELITKRQSYYAIAAIFVLFHMLRINILVDYYRINFQNFIFPLIFYFILLFLFMLTALYLYTFYSKKHSGNFLYPVGLHFATDFTLFFLIMIFGY